MDHRGGFRLRLFSAGGDPTFACEREAILEARQRLNGQKQPAYAEVLNDASIPTWHGWVAADGAVVELYVREPGCDDDLPRPQRIA
jgi:hypothetical protein